MAFVHAKRCLECPILGPACAWRGRLDATFAIVGEAPGEQELNKGEPFIGPSGKLLKKVLTELDVKDSNDSDGDVFITNTIRCRPLTGGVPKQAIEACRSRLWAELAHSPRKVILSLGAVALKSLLGNHALKITQERGKAFQINLPGQNEPTYVVPALHPAAILRQGGVPYPQFAEDVAYAVSLWRGASPKDPGETRYRVLKPDDRQLLEHAIDGLCATEHVAADIETAQDGSLICLGVAWDDNKVLVFPGETINAHLDLFIKLFNSPSPRWIWHNAKSDTTFLQRLGLNARTDDDTMLLHYSLCERRGTHGLKQLAADLIGTGTYDQAIKQYIGTLNNDFANAPRPVTYWYNAIDCDSTRKIDGILRSRATKQELQLYNSLLLPASRFLQRVEQRGIYVNIDRLKELNTYYKNETTTQIEYMHRTLFDSIITSDGTIVHDAITIADGIKKQDTTLAAINNVDGTIDTDVKAFTLNDRLTSRDQTIVNDRTTLSDDIVKACNRTKSLDELTAPDRTILFDDEITDCDRTKITDTPNNPDRNTLTDNEANSRDRTKYIDTIRSTDRISDLEAFNPDSWQQVKPILYDRFNLRPLPQFEDKFEWNTRDLSLDMLAKNPDNSSKGLTFLNHLRTYRKITKLHRTYVLGVMLRLGSDGRVHCTFLIHGTETGRLSSNNPNMQNIPREGPVKTIFQAPPGRVLIELDYSQAELRVLALLSGDQFLSSVYAEGRDLHNEFASAVFGPNYTEEQRAITKRMNFGIAYGLTAFNLAYQFDIPLDDAEHYVLDWFKRAPLAKEFLDTMRMYPEKGIPLGTPFNRFRRWGYVGGDKKILGKLSNEACNFPIQSIASDITLMSAMSVEKRLDELDAYIVNLVHDSILIEAPDDPKTIREIVTYVKHVMEQMPIITLKSTIPFIVDAKVGKVWGELERFDASERIVAVA